MMQPALAGPVCAEVVVTADSAELLTELTHALVKERLVAYGYTTSPVQAVYHQGDDVRDETHARASLHTRATLVPDVVDRLDRDYPGGVRSVVATQLTDRRSDYLQWVVQETAADVDHHAAARRRTDAGSRWSWSR